MPTSEDTSGWISPDGQTRVPVQGARLLVLAEALGYSWAAENLGPAGSAFFFFRPHIA